MSKTMYSTQFMLFSRRCPAPFSGLALGPKVSPPNLPSVQQPFPLDLHTHARPTGSSSDAETAQSDLSPWVKDIFPHFLPFIPSVDGNPVDLQSPNPFLEPDELEVTHPVLRKPATTTRPPPLPSGSVNGFLKFRFSNNKRKYSESFSCPPPLLPAAVDHAASASQHETTSVDPRVLVLRNSSHVPPLPPNFGHVCLRGHTDRALFAFCSYREVMASYHPPLTKHCSSTGNCPWKDGHRR